MMKFDADSIAIVFKILSAINGENMSWNIVTPEIRKNDNYNEDQWDDIEIMDDTGFVFANVCVRPRDYDSLLEDSPSYWPDGEDDDNYAINEARKRAQLIALAPLYIRILVSVINEICPTERYVK